MLKKSAIDAFRGLGPLRRTSASMNSCSCSQRSRTACRQILTSDPASCARRMQAGVSFDLPVNRKQQRKMPPVLSRKTRAKKHTLAPPRMAEAVVAGQTALAQHERVRVPTCRHHLKARLAGSRRLPARLCQAAAVSSPPAGPRPQRTRVPVIVKRKYKKM